jgi:hypothetical protein
MISHLSKLYVTKILDAQLDAQYEEMTIASLLRAFEDDLGCYLHSKILIPH